MTNFVTQPARRPEAMTTLDLMFLIAGFAFGLTLHKKSKLSCGSHCRRPDPVGEVMSIEVTPSQSRLARYQVSVVKIIDVKFADSDQLI